VRGAAGNAEISPALRESQRYFGTLSSVGIALREARHRRRDLDLR
jgi:hypothetical protein